MADYVKAIDKLLELPWSRYFWVLGTTFILAEMFGLMMSHFFMPNYQRSKVRRPSLVGSVATGGATLDAGGLRSILDRNVFNKEGTLGDADATDDGADDVISEKAVKTDLPVQLVGIIYGGTPYTGLATIQNTQKNKINSFIVGDILMKEAEVTAIHRRKVFLNRKGRKEFILLEEKEVVRTKRKKTQSTASKSAGGIPAIAKGPPPSNFKEPGFEREGNAMVMSDEYKRGLLSEGFSKVLQDAKASPNLVDGQVKGFKLTRIREGSIYQKAGFQNNDVVEEINGTPLSNAANAIRLLQALRNEREVEVYVNRGGNKFAMTLRVQ